ncbi:heterokaryon incompatibility protein-domain-containing protein [Xylaria cubensis]|nr:heterokaryon incompatibility protein-domain-containing protein [Xylaria cubensis]
MPTAHSRDELFSEQRHIGIIFGFILVPCWCGYVWLDDHNGPVLARVALFIFNSLFTLGYAPYSPYFLEFIFLSPFYIIKTLLTLFSKILVKSWGIFVNVTISPLKLGLSFVLSTLSPVCVARLPRYRAPQDNGDGDLRHLCCKCRPIVDQSSLLKGTYWVFTWSREIYPFHSKNELQKSAKVCHLCSFLWSASFKNSSTSIPIACEADHDLISVPSVTTPLLSSPLATVQSIGQAQAKETVKLKMEITATRPFRQRQSLHIRILGKQGSDPLVSLEVEDKRSIFTHTYRGNGEDFTNSEGCFEWAKNMLDRCEGRHKFCTNGFISSEDRRYRPKRLIDLVHAQEGIAFLVLGGAISQGEAIGQNHRELRYFALSHCWGGCVKSKLTVANSDQMKAMEITTLDPNFRDAIAITLKMGMRYLWIDSLCIVQDSEEWAEESGNMGLVYARAACVISATASINSNGGCFRRQDFSLYDCELHSHSEDRLVVCQKVRLPEIFDKKVELAVLTTRGWTFQERFLAKRVLHFCSGLVIFECNTLVASPAHNDVSYDTIYERNKALSLPLEPPPKYNYTVRTRHPMGITRSRGGRVRDGVKKRITPEYRKWTYSQRIGSRVWARLGMRGAFNFLVAFIGTGLRKEAEFHVRWFDLVEPYSTRQLTKDSDKVIALLGVAQFIQQNTGLQFVAGLWDRVLPFNLLWTLHGPARDRPRDRVAPTWSWASVDGRISHRLRASDSVPSANYFLGVDKGNGRESTGSWESVESLISDVQTHAVQTVNDMITQATLTLRCSLSPFDKKNLNIAYDTLQPPLPHELLCLPILAFENRKIHPQTSLRQVHGILVRELGTREGGGDAPSRYERVGYFWTVQPSHGLYPVDEGSKQRIELV